MTIQQHVFSLVCTLTTLTSDMTAVIAKGVGVGQGGFHLHGWLLETLSGEHEGRNVLGDVDEEPLLFAEVQQAHIG